MPLMPFLRASAGIHAKVDPVRLRYDPETGVQLLAQAVNVDIDQAGRISRRKGLRKISSATNTHTLWGTADQSKAFLLAGDGLYSLAIDGTLTLIKNGLTAGAQGYFCEVGPDVFFSNGNEKGIIREGISWEDWAATPYTGIDTTRQFIGPPAGKIIAYYRGRVIIASDTDKALWFSEPINYGCFDAARGFISFGGEFRMVAPVDNGIYVSAGQRVYFLGGTSPEDFELREVLRSPVVKGSVVNIRAEWFRPETIGAGVCFVAQDEGVCMGFNDGMMGFLTKERVDLPPASHGVSIVDHNDNYRYITFLEI